MPAILAIAAAPAGATALLLLATHRAWLCRRAWVESIVFLVGFAFIAWHLCALPAVVLRATATFAALGAFWFGAAWAAWRFAPDCGQAGFAWVWSATVRPAVHAGFGLAIAHAVLARTPIAPPFHLCLLAAAALISRHAARSLPFFSPLTTP